MSYDLIGDIHGCATTLAALLDKLGYTARHGVYRHPTRQVIFLGDFIDRGPGQREVLEIVRPMVDASQALAVMGNHEFNAIAFHTRATGGHGWLRPHTDKNTHQHAAFLDAYANDDATRDEAIAWFKTLPLWLDLGALRIVHACWDTALIESISNWQDGSNRLSDALLHQAVRASSWQFEAIETLLKGKELPLPKGVSFLDKDSHPRHNIRVRWWDRSATTYRGAFIGPASARTTIPDDEIVGDHLITYDHDAPPVFLGHYWLEGEPQPLARNIACLDYSVARPGGKLVAYRFDGEQRLRADRFVSVTRLEP